MKLASIKKSRFISILTTFLTGFLLVASWALASPPGGSPDEPTHLITIYCFSERANNTCLDPSAEKLNLQPVKDISSCYLFQRDRGAGCEVSDIFTKLEKGTTTTFTPYSDNWYYKSMAKFANDYYILSLLIMRVVNGLIFLTVLFLSLYLLPPQLRQAFSIATLVVSVPLGIYLFSSINTSAWIAIGAIGCWAALYSMFKGFQEKSPNITQTILQILLFLFSSFLLISSRSDGIYFFSIILFSMILFLIIPYLKNFLSNYLSGKNINLIIFLFSLLIGLSSIFYFRQLANVTFINNNFDLADRLFENTYRLPHLLLGPLGTWGLGWLDVWLSPITYISMILVFLGLLFFSLRSIDLKHGVPIIILMLSAIALPLIILQTSGYLVGEWVQPRYILPLYYPILGLALLSYAGKQKFSSAQLFIIIFLTSIAHSFALFSNLERYLRGQNTLSYDLTVGLEWWWDQVPSPNLIWIIGSISFTVFFTLLTQKTKVNTKHSQFLQ
jgi:hypothetical protein